MLSEPSSSESATAWDSAAASDVLLADVAIASDSTVFLASWDSGSAADSEGVWEADAALSRSASMLPLLAESSSDAYTVLAGASMVVPNMVPAAAVAFRRALLRFFPLAESFFLLSFLRFIFSQPSFDKCIAFRTHPGVVYFVHTIEHCVLR
jgi:hypothetical protein